MFLILQFQGVAAVLEVHQLGVVGVVAAAAGGRRRLVVFVVEVGRGPGVSLPLQGLLRLLEQFLLGVEELL